MGLFSRLRQLVDVALEIDPPSQSPEPVEPLPGGWSAEQVASLEATTPDRKGLRPGRAVIQHTAGLAGTEPGKTLIDRTGTRVVVRRRLPDGGWGPRADQALRMSRSKLEKVVTGLEVPVLVNAASGEFVRIDVDALGRELDHR
jgi:hypothetical protein